MATHILATHIVKPSSPTPLTSKTHKLSSLDQASSPVYLTFIFFYQNNESNPHQEISQRLKQSLSEILTIFYPLAGTMRSHNSSVDCNDRGAEFVEARVHARLAHFTQNPKTEELQQLLPCDGSSYDDGAAQLLVQTSHFDCGGFAVGVCFLHRIGDVACFVTFMNAWAAACRGEASRIILPSFDLELRFPPSDSSAAVGRRLRPGAATLREKITTKRLVFDREKLGKLKREAMSDEVKDPTSVEALSVFIWRSFIQANKARTPGTTSFRASMVVNLRPRAVPKLPESTFGNCTGLASAVVASGGEEDELVSRLRAAIRAVDGDYVAGFSEAGDVFQAGNCLFSSWWRFPVYEVDFGWGKPVWVGTTPMPYMNTIVLMSNPSRDGIEAWINVPDDQFFRFIQANYDELLAA